MSKARAIQEQMKAAGLIEVNGVYVKASSQVDKKPNKLPSLIERAGIYQQQIDDAQRKITAAVSKLPPLNVKRRQDFKPAGDETKPYENKKVRNATKSVNDQGVKFDSNLEKFMYGLLQGAGIDFDFQVKYLLQEGFRYNGEAVRPISLTVDFVVITPHGYNEQLIIDTKGYANDLAPMKYKMLKKWLVENYRTFDQNRRLPTIELPSTKEECQLLLNRLLFDKP